MKRRIFMLVSLVAVALALVACGGRAAVSEEAVAPQAPPMVGDAYYAESAVSGEAAPVADAALPTDTGSGVKNAMQERLIIRTADMTIVVPDTETALAQIAQMAESGGGWVVSSNIYQSSETSKTGYITIRVPSEGFQSVIDAIGGLATEVTSLNTSGQDVTEEYVDLTSQLANLQATAERVRGFLDESRTVEEALAVNQELSRLEGEIELTKGRMQYLSESSAFSSITVNVTPDELAQPIQVAGWQPTGVARQAVEALVSALQALANVAIWFVIFALPVLIIILIPILLLIWLIRRLRRRERAQETPVTPPTE